MSRLVRTPVENVRAVPTVKEIRSTVRDFYGYCPSIEAGLREDEDGDWTPICERWADDADLQEFAALSSVLRDVRAGDYPDTFTVDLYCYSKEQLEGNADLGRDADGWYVEVRL